MGKEFEIRRDLGELHPKIRSAVTKIRNDLNKRGHPFEIFEAYRTPQRQRYLFEQGRTRPGDIVTKSGPWHSYHQFGLAVDFALKIKGQWSWDTKGARAKSWQLLHELGRKHGLEPLSWELPHLQLANTNTAALRAGQYPSGGDASWGGHLASVIANWDGGGAPRMAPMTAEKPPIIMDAEETDASPQQGEPMGGFTMSDEADDLTRAGVPDGDSAGRSSTQFARVQPIVDKWEGGYVDHPKDPGGATNMGVTQATLARWRDRPVSKSDVKALDRNEVWQIMKAYYYDIVHGDELPISVAIAAHNAAVLSGPARSGKFLQAALAALGAKIAVDGAIGPMTLRAVTLVDPGQLARAFFNVQENYLRSLPHFSVFGPGWLNRLSDVRKYALDLGQEVAQVPAPQIIVGNPGVIVPQDDFNRKLLTPVNNALGVTVGKILNGRKTGIGVAGLTATMLADHWLGDGAAGGVSGAIKEALPYAQPVLAAGTFWGLLGKAEKWLYETRRDRF